MTIAVECNKVYKTYGSGDSTITALHGVDLKVYQGELLMLVGPSGSGKTTLLSVMSGILSHDAGECLVYGVPLNDLKDEEKTAFRGKNIGFVFQAFNLVPMLTAIENVALPLMLNGVKESIAQEKARDLLCKVGLEKRMDATPPHLSGGEQQRVAIARGCVHDPKLIVCDEPTSALDHETGEKVLELLKTIALKDNSALVIVTHDNRIFHFADRMLRMDDGHIIHEQSRVK